MGHDRGRLDARQKNGDLVRALEPDLNSSKPGSVVDEPVSCSASGITVTMILSVFGMTCGMTSSWKPCCTGEAGASEIENVRPPDWLEDAVGLRVANGLADEDGGFLVVQGDQLGRLDDLAGAILGLKRRRAMETPVKSRAPNVVGPGGLMAGSSGSAGGGAIEVAPDTERQTRRRGRQAHRDRPAVLAPGSTPTSSRSWFWVVMSFTSKKICDGLDVDLLNEVQQVVERGLGAAGDQGVGDAIVQDRAALGVHGGA